MYSITAAECLLKHFGRFGAPYQLRSDNGPHFIADLIREFLLLIGVKHYLTLAYSKEENAIVERCNKEINRHLRALTYDNSSLTDYKKSLQFVQRILNSNHSDRLKISATQMLFNNMLNLDRGIFLPLEERPVSIRPYFFICIFMRPSHIAFNRAIRHCTNQSAQLSFKPEYKHTVKFWRAMMTPVALFSQMLACLLGLDILIYRGSNSDIPSEGSAVDISHSRFGENSSYQIVAEFVAAVMRIVMIIKMKLPFMIKDYGVGVTGGSIIALTRISKEKYRGLSTKNCDDLHYIGYYV